MANCRRSTSDRVSAASELERMEPARDRATILGLIAVADTLRPDVVEVVQKLRSIGVKKIVMLTGDHDRVAQTIGRRAGIDEVFSQLLPKKKSRLFEP